MQTHFKPIPGRNPVRWLMTAVYLLSPMFGLVDLGFGHNLRAPGLDTLDAPLPAYVAFYAGITLLGVLGLWLPAAAAPLGVIESGANVLVAGLATLMPAYNAMLAAETGGEFAEYEVSILPLVVLGLLVAINVGSLRSGSLRRI